MTVLVVAMTISPATILSGSQPTILVIGRLAVLIDIQLLPVLQGAQLATHSRYSSKVTIITKIYTDNQKYSRVDNSFDFKLIIFYNIYNRASLLPKGYMTVFPTMLKGLTQAYYYNCSLSSKLFDAACTYIQNFFKGLEYYQKNLIEQNAITL